MNIELLQMHDWVMAKLNPNCDVCRLQVGSIDNIVKGFMLVDAIPFTKEIAEANGMEFEDSIKSNLCQYWVIIGTRTIIAVRESNDCEMGKWYYHIVNLWQQASGYFDSVDEFQRALRMCGFVDMANGLKME